MLVAMLEELPRLHAEYVLDLALAVGIGTGSMKKSERDAAMRDLRRAADRGHEHRAASLEELATLAGVTIERVPRGPR